LTKIAASGRQALECSFSDVDLILLDVVLPDVDGTEICHRLKSNTLNP